jgi:hypothetical protein
LSLVAVAAAGQIASAQTSTTRKADELAGASRELKQQALANKGGPRLRQEQAARRLQKLADDLEAGRPVDPAEIDRLLKKADHGPW